MRNSPHLSAYSTEATPGLSRTTTTHGKAATEVGTRYLENTTEGRKVQQLVTLKMSEPWVAGFTWVDRENDLDEMQVLKPMP